MRKKIDFEYRQGTCPECGEICNVVPLLNEFDFAGTHCTHGLPGTHYPDDWGSPVSDCCEAYIDIAHDYYDVEDALNEAEYGRER